MEIRGCLRRFVHTKDIQHLKDIFRILRFKFMKPVIEIVEGER